MARNIFFGCLLLTAIYVRWCTSNDIYKRNAEDTMTFMDPCVAHSKKSGRMDCICDTDHATVMSKNDENFGCFSPAEMDCVYKLDASEQVYVINRTNPWEGTKTVGITPEVRNGSIKSISIWNKVDDRSDKGLWYPITSEEKTVFKLDGNNLLISNRTWKDSVWNGSSFDIFCFCG